MVVVILPDDEQFRRRCEVAVQIHEIYGTKLVDLGDRPWRHPPRQQQGYYDYRRDDRLTYNVPLQAMSSGLLIHMARFFLSQAFFLIPAYLGHCKYFSSPSTELCFRTLLAILCYRSLRS